MIQERIEQKRGRILEYVRLLRTLQDDCLERFDSDPYNLQFKLRQYFPRSLFS